LRELLEAASRDVNDFCGRPEGFVGDAAASAKYLSADGEPYLYIPACVEISEVAVKDAETDTTYTVWTAPTTMMAGDGDWIPATGRADLPVYSQLPYTLLIVDPNGSYSQFLDGGTAPVAKITAKWGVQVSAPPTIREATLMQAAQWYKQFQGAMDSRLASEEFGEITYRRGLSNNVKHILIDGGWIVPLYGGDR